MISIDDEYGEEDEDDYDADEGGLEQDSLVLREFPGSIVDGESLIRRWRLRGITLGGIVGSGNIGGVHHGGCSHAF